MNALSKARLAPKTNCLLAFLCLALLVLPFHPFWLDFEQVRRGLLAVILGLIAVLLPGRFASLRLPTRLLLCGILWLLLPALASTSSLARQWESLSYLAALVLLTMLSPSVPRATWAVSLPTVILLTSIYGIAQRMGIAEFAGYGAVGEPVSVFGNLNVAAEVTCVGLAACLVLGIERPRWSIAALVIGGAYLPIDGSIEPRRAATRGRMVPVCGHGRTHAQAHVALCAFGWRRLWLCNRRDRTCALSQCRTCRAGASGK